ncbi:MAG TPA: alpha/beta hydrolase [Microbacterium sp.]|nr:alpha/beta hydrolase [Microbacterium sp.]
MTLTSRRHTVAVPVAGGDLQVGVWEGGPGAPAVLLVHGVTSSHLAWQQVAAALPGVRLIAPDLRGRGGSRGIEGSAGLAAHAADLTAVLDHFELDRVLLVGHSMGAFVAVAFAHLHPERVRRLVLIDGGLPLDVPAGLDPDTMVQYILGPAAERLSMRFGGPAEYFGFWHAHPAFARDWSHELEEYLRYDLVPDGAGAYQPATTYRSVVDDTIDMNTTTTVVDALDALAVPTRLITVPRGLQDEEPGLYSAERIPALLAQHPAIAHERMDGFNHYTIVMSDAGARRIASVIDEELAAG